MNRRYLIRRFEELLDNCEGDETPDDIETIVARQLEPLVKRISDLEARLQANRSAGVERLLATISQNGHKHDRIDCDGVIRRNPLAFDFDPYQAQPGPALDLVVHERIMRQPKIAQGCPLYSTEFSAAKKVAWKLKSLPAVQLKIGHTNLPGRVWFARLEAQGDHGTEVLADTLPLAICRLALVEVSRC